MLLEKSLVFLAIVIVLLTLGRFLFWVFPLELLTHFQVHYFFLTVSLILILILLWKCQKLKSPFALFILLFALTFNASDLATWYLPSDRLSLEKTNTLKVMSFNIRIGNPAVDRIVQSIQSIDPDLILIIEIDAATTEKINNMTRDRFPYSFRSSGGDMAIFSKFLLKNSDGQKFYGSNDTNLVTHVQYHNRRVKIIGTHPFVPIKSSTFSRRNLQLDALANQIERDHQPTILMGDFNLTPWSPYYRQFVNKTNLHNTRYGFGILPTWIRPSIYVKLPPLLIPLLNIPIDHIFASKDFKVVRTYTGDNANSDHAPIISELII